MTVSDIVKKYLEDNGYEGLWDEDSDCGCPIDDLFPCSEHAEGCHPGYNRPDLAPDGFDVWICSVKAPEA